MYNETGTYKHYSTAAVIVSEILYIHLGIKTMRYTNVDRSVTLFCTESAICEDGIKYVSGKKLMTHVGRERLLEARSKPKKTSRVTKPYSTHVRNPYDGEMRPDRDMSFGDRPKYKR